MVQDDANYASLSPVSLLSRYCHFCQHVKVRASSMLACENHECSRRFCEHCLLTHLGEDVNPMSSDAWTMVDGKVSLFVTHPFTSHHLFAWAVYVRTVVIEIAS